MKIIEFSLSENIKKQLGYIIRETRRSKFLEYKDKTLIEKNPYTKENFCDNNKICHYHTLTKLEHDFIKEDIVYHTLLKKLGFYYQVTNDEHNKNMEYIDEITKRILYAGEYIDDNLANEIKNELDKVYFAKDIIAKKHLELLQIFINLQLVIKVTEEFIEFLTQYSLFFKGIHQGVAYQCLGIYYLNKFNTEKAKDNFIHAKEIYEKNNISKGLISSYLIAVYVYTNNYYNSVPLCNEMESFYKKTDNYKRLMHVYNYLSDYYLLINAHDVAKNYFDKAIEIINEDETLGRFKYSLYYNWAFRCFKDYMFEDALKFFIDANKFCMTQNNKLQTINMILIVMTKLHYSDNEINKFISEGEEYLKYSNEANKNIFRYFRHKVNKSRYYRKVAIEKIIPMLTDDRSKNEILLFFYEDLYKKLHF